jgi:hypothetical protein
MSQQRASSSSKRARTPHRNGVTIETATAHRHGVELASTRPAASVHVCCEATTPQPGCGMSSAFAAGTPARRRCDQVGPRRRADAEDRPDLSPYLRRRRPNQSVRPSDRLRSSDDGDQNPTKHKHPGNSPRRKPRPLGTTLETKKRSGANHRHRGITRNEDQCQHERAARADASEPVPNGEPRYTDCRSPALRRQWR